MVRTILFAIYFWLSLVLSLLLLLPYAFLKLLRLTAALDTFLLVSARVWSRLMLRGAGARVTVIGAENVPSHGKLCFVSNHQGIADIPLLYGYSGKRPGIIAKKELSKVPILNIWIGAIGGIFIDRKSARQAHKAIERGIGNIRNGLPMAIFPEGTRSRGGSMLPFRPGSLKLATRSGAVIVPLTIDGTWRLLEERNRIAPSDVRLTIHPPIPTEGMTQEERQELPERLEKIIAEGLGTATWSDPRRYHIPDPASDGSKSPPVFSAGLKK